MVLMNVTVLIGQEFLKAKVNEIVQPKVCNENTRAILLATEIQPNLVPSNPFTVTKGTAVWVKMTKIPSRYSSEGLGDNIADTKIYWILSNSVLRMKIVDKIPTPQDPMISLGNPHLDSQAIQTWHQYRHRTRNVASLFI
jgi:hypothetical protein